MLVIFLGLALPSCASDDKTSCDSDLEATECYIADSYAICGESTGPPQLACNESGTCKWFHGGCPAGFIPTDCPADDLCCHDNWPFQGPQTLVDVGPPVARAHRFLYGGQLEPWTPERGLTLDVDVDPDLVPISEFTCEGMNPYESIGSPCEWVDRQTSARLDDTLVVGGQGTADLGWYARIEVEPGDDSPEARVCAYRYTDSVGPTCPPKRPFVCAESGTVTLDRMPTTMNEVVGLQVNFDVVFANGFRHAGSYDVTHTYD